MKLSTSLLLAAFLICLADAAVTATKLSSQDSDGSSSSGNTPPPPQPPADFMQYICSDSHCLSCQPRSYPQNTCLPASDGTSVIIQCTPPGLLLTMYPNSGNCQGFNYNKAEPLNECLSGDAQIYEYNVCPTSSNSILEGRASSSAKVGFSTELYRLPPALISEVQALRKTLR
jgi:hypothetical protein